MNWVLWLGVLLFTIVFGSTANADFSRDFMSGPFVYNLTGVSEVEVNFADILHVPKSKTCVTPS